MQDVPKIESLCTELVNCYTEIDNLEYELSSVEENKEKLIQNINSSYEKEFTEIACDVTDSYNSQLNNITEKKQKALSDADKAFSAKINELTDLIQNKKDNAIAKPDELKDKLDNSFSMASNIHDKIKNNFGDNFVENLKDDIGDKELDVSDLDYDDCKDYIDRYNDAVNTLSNSKIMSLDKLSYLKYLFLFPIKIFEKLFPEPEFKLPIYILSAGLIVLLILTFSYIVIPIAVAIGLAFAINRYMVVKSIKDAYEDYYLMTNSKQDFTERINDCIIEKQLGEEIENINTLIEKLKNKKTIETQKIHDFYNSKIDELNSKFDVNKLIEENTSLMEQKRDLDLRTKQAEFDDNVELLKDKLSRMESIKDNLVEGLNAMTKEIPKLIMETNDSHVMNTKLYIGDLYNNKYSFLKPYFADVKQGSYCFLYNEDTQDLTLDYIKFILAQLITNVREKDLKIRFIDTLTLGKVANEFLIQDRNIIDTLKDDEEIKRWEDELTEELIYRNEKILKSYSTLDDYNSYMESINGRTVPYYLTVGLNFSPRALYSNQYIRFLQQASITGIMHITMLNFKWIHSDKQNEKELFERILSSYDYVIDTSEFKVMNKECEELTVDLNYTYELPNRFDRNKLINVAENLQKRIEENKIDIIPFKNFRDQLAPQMFTKSSQYGLEFLLGYLDGDTQNPYGINFDDTDPCALMGGIMGSGKSNTLNVMLGLACERYSPDEFEFYLADFKRVEATVYAKPVKVAQASCVAGTSDADYVISLFEHIMTELEYREKIFSYAGVKKLSEYRDLTKAQIDEININLNKNNIKINGKDVILPYKLPRLLFIIDEFQQMFEISDDVSEKAKTYIKQLAKKGRALGIHLLFTSQSMSGTVSEDVLGQFKTRIALPCNSEVSKTLIGNGAASKISKGYAIINTDLERKESENKVIKIPMITTEELKDTIVRTRTKCEELNIEARNAIFFDEKEIKTHQGLINMLGRIKGFNSKPNILFGEKNTYTTSVIPLNTSLKLTENENMLICSQNIDVYTKLLATLLFNFTRKENSKIFIANGDSDLSKKLDMEYYFGNNIQIYDSLQFEDIMPTIDLTLKQRMENESVRKVKLYFVINFAHKMIGLGRDADYSIINKMKQILIDAYKYNIHFIFGVTEASCLTKLLPTFNHRIVGKLDESSSYSALGNKKGTLLQENIGMYYNYVNSTFEKFKIYDIALKNFSNDDDLEIDEAV